MKNLYYITLATALTTTLAVSAPAFAADDGAALFNKNGCALCHSPDKKKLGPALKEIAAKYKDNKDAQAMLEKKVRAGGSGNWGSVAMPPTPSKASDENIKAIVEWVLAQK